MFEKVDQFFEGKESLEKAGDQAAQPTERDLHIATAVLLVEIASADRKIAPREGEAVVATMSKVFGLPEKETPELVKIAIASRKEKGRVDEFLDCVSRKFDQSRKLQVLAMLWKVVIADGAVDKLEQRMLRRIKETMQLSDADAEEALRMAQHGEV